MNAVRILAIALIVGGLLSLVYGSFSYTKETREVKLGPVDLSVAEKRTVDIPVWVGAGAMALGGLLVFFGSGKR